MKDYAQHNPLIDPRNYERLNMKNANYRKHNDGTHNSSTYHKKDGTPIRAILKREAQQEIEDAGYGIRTTVENRSSQRIS